MNKYITKPIVILATQWFAIGDHPMVYDYHTAVDHGYRCPDSKFKFDLAYPGNNYSGKGLIKTQEGWEEVSPGDFIIQMGTTCYPCKLDLFESTFERMNNA